MPRGNRRELHLRVPVTDSEARSIASRAAASSMSVAAYLRTVALEAPPRTELDQARVDALCKAMADLGRLGGLLKLWLTDDAKLAAFPQLQVQRSIPDALRRIRQNQEELLNLIRELGA